MLFFFFFGFNLVSGSHKEHTGLEKEACMERDRRCHLKLSQRPKILRQYSLNRTGVQEWGGDLEGVLAKNKIGRRHMEIHHFIHLIFQVWKEVPYTVNKVNPGSHGKSKENQNTSLCFIC